MFIKRKKKGIPSAKPQFPVEKGCWILKHLYRLSWQGGATRWVHDARLVTLTAALPLSPPACNLYLLTPPHALAAGPHPTLGLCVCVCVCVEKAFAFFLSPPRHGFTSWLPPCESLRCGEQATGGPEMALALGFYLPSNWSKMAVKIPD